MPFSKLTKQQQNNLIKLRNYMAYTYGNKQYSVHFDMNAYASAENVVIHAPKDLVQAIEEECNTCCCLAGHGPLAGIPFIEPTPEDRLESEWNCYTRQAFGLRAYSYDWKFLFSSSWKSDIQEAIARLDTFIKGEEPRDEINFKQKYLPPIGE